MFDSALGLRVLIMSHMHPAASKGGAEIAAYQHYTALREAPEVAHCWFLAAAGGRIAGRLGVRLSQPFGPDEYVYSGTGFDHFIHANPDPEWPEELAALLAELRPDVVHLHHYTNFGIETLLTIRRVLPRARIVLTLHEYLAICHHFGQMVKRPSLAGCDRATPRDCHRCFPERSEQDFFLRELYLKRFLRLVDDIVAPSRFLADRYTAWGLDATRITVIENGMPPAPPPAPARAAPGIALGFFGQISRLKGIDVLFDAAALLDEAKVEGLQIDVHGDHSGQPPEFRDLFEARLRTAPPNIQIHGPYENHRVGGLMRQADAVLVPSIWWENSPLVIQEAFRAGRPVICSDIGGLAEKVRDGVDGFHFRAGNARALAALLRELAAAPARLRDLVPGLAVPPGIAETTSAMLRLYAAPRALHPTPRGATRMMIRGSVDSLTAEGASGWIHGGAPRALTVQALLDGRVIGETVAEQERPDLAAAGIGDGRCGFAMAFHDAPIDPALLPFISFRPRGGDVELPRTNLTGYGDFFRTIHARHPAAGRPRSVFGGLWTDRTDARRLLAGRVATGATPGALHDALRQFIDEGYLLLRGAVGPSALDGPALAASMPGRPLEAGRDMASRALLDILAGMLFQEAPLRLLRAILDDHPSVTRLLPLRDAAAPGFVQPSAAERLPSPAECLLLVFPLGGDGALAVDIVRGSHELPEFTAHGRSRWLAEETPGREPAGLELARAAGASLDSLEVGARDLLLLGPGTLHRLREVPKGVTAMQAWCLPGRISPSRALEAQSSPAAVLRHASGAMVAL